MARLSSFYVLERVGHGVIVHDETAADIGYKGFFDGEPHFFVGFDGIYVVFIHEKSDAWQVVFFCKLGDFGE